MLRRPLFVVTNPKMRTLPQWLMDSRPARSYRQERTASILNTINQIHTLAARTHRQMSPAQCA